MTDPGTSYVPDPPALPGQPGGLAARFSVDEVAELAALLGLTPPTSISNQVRAADSGDERAPDTDADAVRQGLYDRGVLRVDAEQQLLMDDDAVAILTTICTPALVVTVSTGLARAPQRRTVYSGPGGAIVETSRELRGEQTMHYLSLPNEAILPSLLRWTGLASQPMPAPVPEPGELTVESANAVTVLRRPGGLLTVTLIAWNDYGATGLWRVEQDAARALYGQQGSGLAGQTADQHLLELEDPVTLSPISGEGVLELIQAALR